VFHIKQFRERTITKTG